MTSSLTCKDCDIALVPVEHNIWECPTCGIQFDVDADNYIEPTLEAVDTVLDELIVGYCPHCNSPLLEKLDLCPTCGVIFGDTPLLQMTESGELK